MQKLNELVESRKSQYDNVLRRFHIMPESSHLETIKKGISQKGAPFEIALIAALRGSNFSNFSPSENADNEMGPFLPEGWTPPDGEPIAGTGKFWDFLTKALGAAGSVGDTIAKLRADVTGELSPSQMQLQLKAEEAKAAQTKMLVWGAVIAVVVIVSILLFKK